MLSAEPFSPGILAKTLLPWVSSEYHHQSFWNPLSDDNVSVLDLLEEILCSTEFVPA